MKEKSKILVVDDHEDNLKLLELKIRSLGYSVLFARSGLEALDIARRELPDAMLLDIKMPHMDGFEVCKRLKSDELLKDIPVIFLTALRNEKDLVKGLELGAQDYIVKPFEIQELAARLKVALRLRHLQKQLMGENNKLEAILENIPEGIFSIDSEGEILQWNRGAESITGYMSSEATGKNFLEVIRLYDGKKAKVADIENLDSIIKSRAVYPIERDELFLLNRDNNYIPVSVILSPIVIEGRTSSVVVTLQDITRQKEIETMKEEVLVTVSHDLKTPLFVIRGFIEMLLSPKLQNREKEQQDILKKIKTASVTLVRLINNLLFLRKSASGYDQFRFSRFSLKDLAVEVMELFIPLAEERELKMGHKITGNIDVEADREKMEGVFYNLISNAIKYSNAGGGITISALEKNDEVEVSVTDSGQGIPAEQIKNIFKKFYQVKEVKNGHGIGLYICDRIVKGHKSTLRVESTPGKGSRFYFCLKKAAEEE